MASTARLSYVECDLPEDLTLVEWRRRRCTPARRATRARLRLPRARRRP